MRHVRRLFEFSKDLMCVARMDGYFEEVNPAFQNLLGYSNRELTEVPFIELVHPDDQVATLAELENLKNGQTVLQFENRYRCRDGTFKWLAWVATPQVEENRIYAVARDVTDSKQSLDSLMSDLPGMVYRCLNDADWTMNFVSSGCRELTGYTAEEFVEKKSVTYESIVHPEDRERLHSEIQTAIEHEREFQVEYRIITSSGEEKYVWERGRAINEGNGEISTLQGFIFDITDRHKLEIELNELQRMESLGQMTGGVAHDFNNLLTIMTGNLQLLESRAAGDAEAIELIRDALDSAWRGAELCQRLLAFGRRQALNPELTAINDLVERVEKLVSRTIGESIDIKLSLRNDLPDVMIDPGQLENAIVNLALNARDAMSNGGKLHMRTDLFAVETEYAEAHPDVAVGDYVVVEVSDTGTGMEPGVRERAFEPFFTTKEPGKGTGLGLSTVYGLMKQSGGHVRIYSESGHGTSVKLYIPIARAEDTSFVDTITLVASELVAGGDERILVVEDDPGVRKTVVTTLSHLGYSIVEADSGTAALERLEDADAPVDLLFTDVVMSGGVDGVALAKQAVLIDKRLKVLLTSGFSRDHLSEGDTFALLNKPYRKEQLAAAVRQVLDS